MLGAEEAANLYRQQTGGAALAAEKSSAGEAPLAENHERQNQRDEQFTQFLNSAEIGGVERLFGSISNLDHRPFHRCLLEFLRLSGVNRE